MEDLSRCASSKDSPELVPQDEEGQGASLKECPLEFWEITEGLMAGGTPEGEIPASMGVHEASTAPILLMEPMIAMVAFTTMERAQRMDAVYVLLVTTLMEILNLPGLTMAVGHQGATVEELAEDLAEGFP